MAMNAWLEREKAWVKRAGMKNWLVVGWLLAMLLAAAWIAPWLALVLFLVGFIGVHGLSALRQRRSRR